MNRIGAIGLLVLLAACSRDESAPTSQRHAPEQAGSVAQSSSPSVSVSPLPASYSGVLPCADCEGIRYDLDLRNGGAYILRTTYLGKPANTVFSESGSWTVLPPGTLSLQSSDDTPELFAVVDSRTLRKLDLAGQSIESQLKYDITRQDAYTPLEPPMLLQESSEVTHELIGTRWALVRLGAQSVTIREGGREPFIALESADARAVGYAGCNRITGGYELSGEQLSFTQMASTRMACPDMQTEDTLLKALDATARWQISGAQLDLFNAAGASVASFEARNL